MNTACYWLVMIMTYSISMIRVRVPVLGTKELYPNCGMKKWDAVLSSFFRIKNATMQLIQDMINLQSSPRFPSAGTNFSRIAETSEDYPLLSGIDPN